MKTRYMNVLIVEGPAGAGKSTYLDSLQKEVEDSNTPFDLWPAKAEQAFERPRDFGRMDPSAAPVKDLMRITESVMKWADRGIPAPGAYVPLYTFIRIETEEVSPFARVSIACESDGMGFPSAIIRVGKITLRDTWLGVVILPAWMTGTSDWESETCTVTVGDCPATDTFQLDYSLIFGIPVLP